MVDETSKPAHGKVFKKWANRAMESIPGILVTTTHDYEIQYKYAWACQTEKCGAVIQRQSRSIDVEKQVCGRCKGRLFEIEVPKRGTGKSVDKTPKKQRTLSDYNRFIKQNSAQVRTRLTLNLRMTGDTFGKVTQGDVMKECAKLWKEQKENP